MQRSEALKKAEQLINGARARTHGDAKDTHESIAKIMNVLWRHKIKSELTYDDIYKLCIVQNCRSQNPKNMDNPIDVIGYAALWAEEKVARINVDYQLNMKSKVMCIIFVKAKSLYLYF